MKVSCRARATPTPLFRLVSKSDPWIALVPPLVVTMMEVGRENLAEEALFSTLNSWIESRPGWRAVTVFQE